MKKLTTYFTMIIMILVITQTLVCNASSDAGDEFSKAKIIETNTLVTDNISSENDKDYFKFVLKNPGLISVKFVHNIIYDENEIWSGKIYNQYGEELYSHSFVGNKDCENTCEIGLEKGTYFFQIGGSSRINLWDNVYIYDSCDYSFTINYYNSSCVEKELNDSFQTATSISTFCQNKGSLNDVWDCDYYTFEIDESGNKFISFIHPMIYEHDESESFEIRLYDSTGSEIKYISSLGNQKETKELVYLKKGFYYIRVGGGYSYGGHLASQKFSNTTYSLGVYDYIDKVSITDSYSSLNSITLKWLKVSGATGYAVYKYDPKNKKYKKITTVIGDTSYKVSKLSSGTTFKFKIRAYKKVDSKFFWGDYSTAFSTATKPTITSKITATQTTTSITLKWSKVTGATGYRIYQYNSKTKKYEKIKDTTSRSYTIKKLKAGTTYKFKIKAYSKVDGKTLWGSATDAFYTATKPVKVTLSKVTASSKQATLTWKTVSAASGYQIVYSTDKDFDNAKKVTVSGKSTKKTTIKKLTKGKKYYFKVRAYKTVNGKKIYGAYSSVKSVKVK